MQNDEYGIGKIQNYYVDFSRDLSSVNRQLAFAGIAAVWILGNEATSFTVKNIDFSLMVFFISSLAIDLLHYIVGAWGWGILQSAARDSGEEGIEEPKSLKISIATLAFIKVSLTIIGYLIFSLTLLNIW